MLVLSIFGQLEELMSEHLYPYRYVITPIALAVLAGFLAFAYSKGAHLFLWRHRVASVLVGVPLLVVAGFTGSYLVSPLFERTRLVEASPLETVAPSGGAGVPAPGSAPASAGARAVQGGQFEGADDFHFGRGKAILIANADGSHVLRFEEFSIRNGPDLYVYLSRDVDGKRVDEKLNLGKLKATDGAFNYEVPASIDVATVKSVLVWCRQFAVLFASAELERV